MPSQPESIVPAMASIQFFSGFLKWIVGGCLVAGLLTCLKALTLINDPAWHSFAALALAPFSWISSWFPASLATAISLPFAAIWVVLSFDFPIPTPSAFITAAFGAMANALPTVIGVVVAVLFLVVPWLVYVLPYYAIALVPLLNT